MWESDPGPMAGVDSDASGAASVLSRLAAGVLKSCSQALPSNARSLPGSSHADHHPLHGRWADPSGSFLAGSSIEIRANGWGPVSPRLDGHDATYTARFHSHHKVNLVERRQDGSTYVFVASSRPGKTLLVSMPAIGAEWVLVSHKPAMELFLCNPFLRFEDEDEERRHTEELDLQNRQPLLRVCVALIAYELVEFVCVEILRQGAIPLIEVFLRFCMLLAVMAASWAVKARKLYADTGAVLVACLSSVSLQIAVLCDESWGICGCGPKAMWPWRSCGVELTQDGPTVLLLALLTCATHSLLEVRVSRSWMIPASQVSCYLLFGLLDAESKRGTDAYILCALMLMAIGLVGWLRRWFDEQAERDRWAEKRRLQRRYEEHLATISRTNDILDTQAQLQELHANAFIKRMKDKVKHRRSSAFMSEPPHQTASFQSGPSDSRRPSGNTPAGELTAQISEGDSDPGLGSIKDLKLFKSAPSSASKSDAEGADVRAVASVKFASPHDGNTYYSQSEGQANADLRPPLRSPPGRPLRPEYGELVQEDSEVTARLRDLTPTNALSKSVGSILDTRGAGLFGRKAQARSTKVPRPTLPLAPRMDARVHESPNAKLVAAMHGCECDAALVRSIAQRIREPSYSLRMYFEDCLNAFPELGLFFLPCTLSSGRAAEEEYQRTIGAFFAVYWLLRVDVRRNSGRRGFCFGVDDKWNEESESQGRGDPSKAHSMLTEDQKRYLFYKDMDWAKFSEIVNNAIASEHGKETERIEAMLCLTAFHDIMKIVDLCPAVSEEHAPYAGFEAGVIINDHDIALAYVLEHYGHLLPSFNVLSPAAKKAVLFSQAKLQFNHGWFVQAEAPPGAMLANFKRMAQTACASDIAFYFFHWLTDLAGAEGTPLAGAEKFVVKFPPSVLKAFIWSMPFLQLLQDSSETQVVEEYLQARWKESMPERPVPIDAESVAIMRLNCMAGTCGPTAVNAFQSLSFTLRTRLAQEMSMTGLKDQVFSCSPLESIVGPAFLIYYGPALLQRCHADAQKMRLALCALMAVFHAGRELWPAEESSCNLTVTLEISQLKGLDIEHVYAGEAAEGRRQWALVRQNDHEAVCKLLSGAEINQLMYNERIFQMLEVDGEEDQSIAGSPTSSQSLGGSAAISSALSLPAAFAASSSGELSPLSGPSFGRRCTAPAERTRPELRQPLLNPSLKVNGGS